MYHCNYGYPLISNMASGDYACGMEPTNTYLWGRKVEREKGTLQVLKPFESAEFGVTFTFEKI